MNVKSFHAQRRFVDVSSGRIAHYEQGTGPVALFIHGVPLNGYHWRHVIAGLSDARRCIALDLMGLGYTEISPGQDVSFSEQARMIGQFLDALGIDCVDLIGNDSGGAISQIFATRNPERLRSLTLTNCDVHELWLSPEIKPTIQAARDGKLADIYQTLLDDPAKARAAFARAYANPEVLTDDVVRVYLEPLLATPERRAAFHRYWTSFDMTQTTAIEPGLRALQVPTLIVWGPDDIFFGLESARWLQATIPGVTRLVEVPDAKLFFAEDRPQALLEPLRAFYGIDGAVNQPRKRANATTAIS
jgi:pimeloyl-ACP methyl ester carboxylesterase